MELKLFTARVIWMNPVQRFNSWFTVLGKDTEDIEEAVMTRLRSDHALSIKGSPHPKDVSVMEVTEIVGPFENGQILHEERGGDMT